MRFILDIPNNKAKIANEIFKNISFVKNISKISDNEIPNLEVLKSIESYEAKKNQPQIITLADLKNLLDA